MASDAKRAVVGQHTVSRDRQCSEEAVWQMSRSDREVARVLDMCFAADGIGNKNRECRSDERMSLSFLLYMEVAPFEDGGFAVDHFGNRYKNCFARSRS